MTVSIGLSQYKQKEEVKAFVHRIDQLMYQAKKNGRDRICSDHNARDSSKVKRKGIESCLKKTKNNSQVNGHLKC
jgi:predicted signal transduction protein with EAL and GGDEF domain